jgi:hypothetical protein
MLKLFGADLSLVALIGIAIPASIAWTGGARIE